MNKERILLWLVILVLGGLLAVMIWDNHRRPHVMPVLKGTDTALIVPTRTLRPENVTLTQTYLGTVQAIHSVPVQSYLSGFIDKIQVKGGQSVKSGDLMFVLQQGTYQAARDQALAQAAQAEANLANAAAYLKRIRNTASKAVSKTELDNATASFLSAEANVKAAKAAVKTADVNYGYTEIKAPINGIIGDVNVTVGDYVSPAAQPLVTIVQYNPIRVVFSIPYKEYTSLIGSVFNGWQMRLRLSDGHMYSETGEIRFTDNQVNAKTASVRLYADFKNADKILLPNAFVTVLMTKTVRGILVNKGWVHLTPAGDFIYILKDGRIEKQSVRLGPAVDDSFVITQNLPDNYVVITGQVQASQIGRRAVSSSSRTDTRGK